MTENADTLLAARHGCATTLEIDLDAVSNNVRGLRNHLSAFHPVCPELIAVVKASGYGAGGPALARHFVSEGVAMLAVARTEEGVELRQAGIEARIVVLNPAPDSFSALRAARLEPELYSLAHLKAFLEAFPANEQAAATRWPVHLKFDTGMYRLGFSSDDLAELVGVLRQAESRLVVETVFSHLAAADDPKADDETRRQIARFTELVDDLKAGLSWGEQPSNAHPLKTHLLNTAGAARFPEAAGDYVRVGLGLFGIAPGPDMILPWEAARVAHFRTCIIHLQTIPADQGAGYGYSDASPVARQIATLPVGYADGYPRRLSNGNGSVGIRGKLAPVVGRVCMDLTLVDVTAIPGAALGDCATLFGAEPSIETVAAAADTIPYELLCRIPLRVARVYTRE